MAVPDTPNSLCSRCVSVEWQTVSKAADRSRPISTKSAVRRKPVRKLRYVGRHRGRRGCRQGSASELSRFARSKCGNCVMSGGIVVTDDVWSSACLPVRTFQGSVMSSHHPVSGWATFCIPLLPCNWLNHGANGLGGGRSPLHWSGFSRPHSAEHQHTRIYTFFPNCFINLLIPPPCLRGPFVIPHMSWADFIIIPFICCQWSAL